MVNGCKASLWVWFLVCLPLNTLWAAEGSSVVDAGDEAKEISLSEWDTKDWMLIKPKVTRLELDGYFRLRGDLFRRLDLGNGVVWDGTERYPAPPDGKANVTGTNMRLRIEPKINISEGIQIISTWDVFDNLVFGGTPNSDRPTDTLTSTQVSPSGTSALNDSLYVKRAYARLYAMNEQLEVRVGRMSDHWGLGVFANDGDCFDCDYGSVVDRAALTFKIAQHVWVPMVDWLANGPVITPFGGVGGQPLDALNSDDAMRYSLRIVKTDHDDDIRESVLKGQTVWNYGLWNALQRQDRGLRAAYYASNDLSANAAVNAEDDEKRDANIYLGSAFLKVYRGILEFGLEGTVLAGSFRDKFVDTSAETTEATNVLQVGGAMDATWRFGGDYEGTTLSLKAGGASGDSAAGFGALDQAAGQRGASVTGTDDYNLNNFQFSPDYHVDLILFRRLLGTVTDAWYVRPEVGYQFNERVNGGLAAIYSQALFKRSTPAYAEGESGENPLGFEVNVHLDYSSEPLAGGGVVKTGLAYGFLFPLGAFKNRTLELEEQDPEFAQTLQARLYLSF
ncbi:MAG: TIGR04551 family protein [Myxococcota bacterium]|jgi:uncharacterized protein (TIGR04551 family)|nr:TIGR04551 family protein [Myxococcota bacterium]